MGRNQLQFPEEGKGSRNSAFSNSEQILRLPSLRTWLGQALILSVVLPPSFSRYSSPLSSTSAGTRPRPRLNFCVVRKAAVRQKETRESRKSHRSVQFVHLCRKAGKENIIWTHALSKVSPIRLHNNAGHICFLPTIPLFLEWQRDRGNERLLRAVMHRCVVNGGIVSIGGGG